MDFSLSSYFNSFDVGKEYQVEFSDLESKLETITNSLADNPESLNFDNDLLEDVIELVHGFLSLEGKHQKQLAYLITSSFNAIGLNAIAIMENGDFFVDSVNAIKSSLEKYGYLMFVILKFLGKEDFSQIVSGRSQKSTPKQVLVKWKSNCFEVENCLTSIVTILKIDLGKIFVTTPERDAYLELFTRPLINLMESSERMKLASIRLLMFKIIAVSVKNHGHAAIIQHSVIQCLTYYAHLPNYMAELLHIISDEYDYILLTEEILREISQIHFSSNDTNGPRAVSEFLVKLSELSPRLILKQMTSICQLFDNSNPTLRCSLVESCGNIVLDILESAAATGDDDEDGHNGSQQVEKLLELLQERVLDQNPYVRTKAFQALAKIVGLKVKLTEVRQKLMMVSVRSLDDKSTLVRRNTIKLMSRLVLNHQFQSPHGTQLGYKFWKQKLDEAEADLLQYVPVSPRKQKKTSSVDDMDIDKLDEEEGHESEEESNEHNMEEEQPQNVSDKEQPGSDEDDEVDHEELNTSMVQQEQNLPDRTVLFRAKLKVNFYQDAVDFIEAVQHGTEVISRLLFSKNRNEAIDSMDFLVLADAYGIENASIGIRKMLHLVWMKGSSDEGKSVPSHLIDCYKTLFLTAPSEGTRVEQAAYMAKNLIGLTYDASIADLASLEKLLGLMYNEKLINSEVIRILWQIYALDNEEHDKQRRGAVMVLGMLAVEDNEIIIGGLDSLLRIGLGSKKSDLTLCRYTCLALSRIIPSNNTDLIQIPNEVEAISKLKSVLLDYNDKLEWYIVAQETIGAIFQASSNPDLICSEIIREKANSVFVDDETHGESKTVGLSQLLFIVGQVAIKTIVYLEKLEGQFKKKKHEAESKKSQADPKRGKNNGDEDEDVDNELEMIGGTSEDDFTDAVIHVKEKELLYGDNSMLARFGPLAKEICSKSKRYNDSNLQRSALLCMVKLMCVSSVYCEENLPLLLTILEKSQDPIIRCNCILGLGDMAVCFNNVVDQSTDFIYRHLTDSSVMVQRTCLMTVTFLILAGQVKVKGQLSSMAKCLENPDQGISDMCRLFFAELATKDNAIYNGFIDIFSGLSNDESLSKDAMKRITKFLLSFIDKERHQKQLAEKLLVRLTTCHSQDQWNDVAFVLGAIPYKNENITTALEKGFALVSAKD
ncbi:Condensin complex subunit 1 [Spathaspora sp. JA1]|nr:Condensin complex subunit 1 [Spathaspora sp. JA1]